jgi:tight adherence protein B
VVDAVEQGAPLLPELDDWARARPVAAVRLASAAVAVGAANGGRQARAIEAVATTLRERAAVHHEAVGLATQARASALLMTVTPIVFAIVASIVDPPLGHVLLHTPLGLGCLAIGLALDGAAAAWMAQITGGHS